MPSPRFIQINLQPNPALLCASCLIYSVSVSSFVYRRHEREPAQTAVFVMVVTATMLVAGCVLGVGLDALMLRWIPWVINIFMVLAVAESSRARNGQPIESVNDKI